MEKDFEEFIAKRCEKALMNSKAYRDLQEQSLEAILSKDMDAYSEINTSMIALAESACYRLAFSDFLKLFANNI